MISRRTLLTTLAAASAACNRKPGTGYRGAAFVATEGASSVVAVDLLAFAVRTRIELPASPSDLVHHPVPGRNLIYAVSPRSRTLEEIDTRARARTRSIKLSGVPLTVIPRDGKLWCLLRDQPQLLPLDSKPIPLPASPVALDISPKAPLACITLDNGSAVLIDLDARRILASIKLDDTLGAVRFRSDGKVALVAGRGRHLLTVLDVASRQVMTELPLALSPDTLCMNPDGGQLFITGQGRDAVVIAYPYRTEIAQTSLSGRKPGSMAVASTPDFLFVANPEAGSVTVFDIATQKVVAITGVGVEPCAITITPDQQFALVLNRASGDMAVIRIAAITGGRSKSAPLFTMIPVGSNPTSTLVTPA